MDATGYRVERGQFAKHHDYAAVYGAAPTVELACLLDIWHRQGFKYLSHELAKQIGASIVVVGSPHDEKAVMARFAEVPIFTLPVHDAQPIEVMEPTILIRPAAA